MTTQYHQEFYIGRRGVQSGLQVKERESMSVLNDKAMDGTRAISRNAGGFGIHPLYSCQVVDCRGFPTTAQ